MFSARAATVVGTGPWSQVHHVDGWVAHNGQTNINDLTLACGPDNRLVEEGGWTNPKTPRWPHRMATPTPPRHRPNPHQQLPPPERYLMPEDDREDDR